MGCAASISGADLAPSSLKYEKAVSSDSIGTAHKSSPEPVPVVGTPVSHKRISQMQETIAEGVPVLKWPQKLLGDAPDHPWMVYKVLSFLPWSQKAGDVLCLSSTLRRLFNPGDPRSEYWRWLCSCICNDAFLYLPSSETEVKLLAGGEGSDMDGDYRMLLKELWILRHRFIPRGEDAGDAGVQAERFRVSTFCRMRPPRPAALDGAAAFEMLTAVPVQLPLNQRVALLQQKNPKLTRAAAMKMLMNKECGAAKPLESHEEKMEPKDSEKTEATKDAEGQADADLVSDISTAPGFSASVVSVNRGQNGSVLTVSPGIGFRTWQFANVFDQHSSQRDLYERCGLRLSTSLVNGQSGALIVYGQTGSGKTHTMFGPPRSTDGLVTRIAADILAAVKKRRDSGFEVHLGVSYVEVFGNDITNLLGGPIGANRGQNQRMGHKYVLEGQCEEPVPDQEAFSKLLESGEERKRKAHTEMNERSTRAHSLVILRLRQRSAVQETFVESILSLVDLGGSEKVSKSKANENACTAGGVVVGDTETARVTWAEYYKSRERITETNHINKGLLTLKRCVQALNERQRCKPGEKLPRVPFQDSKLTQLLQPAWSGESSTSVVVCCSPEDKHAEETVQSLRFGEMCSSVEQERGGAASQDPCAAVSEALKRIDGQIKELEAVILKKERWEWRQTTRKDVVDALDTGGVECDTEATMELGGKGAITMKADDGSSKKHSIEQQVWGQVLVGAEEENARREELIQMRLKLLGEA
mmetsp:Transcript_105782/g.188174  ORF Transcript_105782/g.188174 Transcript_105782/m.188174 type:complete len:758 (-) Transcript_105782:32-2305(-)|eukprot:CAMPEP_0197654818 /NCGR_PEP_ID=MMETSP1338-20131121/39072_1 /TAXON_ID=43686 ORGANISM="Pelagodinium beii, Strain RCC1491" /NCGR_SAMPLE_ID=MMETSP1338 /ASSEMBLY_ACC=CAM_ASM_000754 /LENGTH=757 /DNA_ID=CAMNT_0043230335 /DNA_START=49 /DNA_END=2322 /DNA_ORIENTATION=-